MAGRGLTGPRAVVVPLLAAAVLGTVAVVAVREAGCSDPGHYVAAAGGYELVGGCFAAEDLLVPATPQPAADEPAAPVPTRS